MNLFRRPVAGLAALSILLGGSITPVVARSEIIGQTYRNTDYGFQVTAPADWSITKNVGAALVLLESSDGQITFRAYGKLLAGLTSPSEQRRMAKSQYGIRGRETTVQRLIESWEGREPVYLPPPGEVVSEESLVGPLEGEALPDEPRDEETAGEAEPEGGMDDDPDAGEVILRDLTVMEALILLQGTTGNPYKDAAARERELEKGREEPDGADPLTAVLAELAEAKPYLAIYEQELADPATGEVRRTTHLVCYVLRNMVGYTFVATVPTERFDGVLRELTGIYQSLHIPTLDGGGFSGAGAFSMDPQTTGVLVGKVLIRGMPVPGAKVFLYRTEEDYRAGRVYKTGTSNYSGEFQLVGIPPGTYFLLEASAELGGEKLSTYLPITRIKIQRGFGSFYNLELDQAQ